jgi:hypothetical protein
MRLIYYLSRKRKARHPPTPLTTAKIIIPNAFITMTNSKGDKPWELLKKPMGVSFTKTEKHTEEIQ